jgi:DNA polymerase III subunit epsilon
MILFYDTETTGLPLDWKSPSSNTDNWPHMVQLAWQLCQDNGDDVETHSYII